MNATPVNNTNKKDHAAAVAGTYNGGGFYRNHATEDEVKARIATDSPG